MATVSMLPPAVRRQAVDSLRFRGWAVVLSLVLHALWLAGLLWLPLGRPPPNEPAMVSVDLVVPETPRQVTPTPTPTPPPSAPPPSSLELPPPPKPVLDDVPVERQSRQAEDKLSPAQRRARDARTIRTLRDVILSEVAHRWSPPAWIRGRNARVSFKVDVLPGGMFGPPYGKDAPWTPSQAISGFDALPQGSPTRQLLEDLYRTLRQIQPIHIPGHLVIDRQLTVTLDFRFDDMP